MTVEEIRDISIDSANAYYNYLDKNEKGIQEVEVFELTYLENKDLLIKLRLSAKLFDTESIFFKSFRNGKKYDTSSVKIVEYDGDKNILLIKPTNEVISEFTNLVKTDLKVISDLKFLIQRVKSWYELNGSKISLPTKISKISNKIDEIEYFKEKEFIPSNNQIDSIRNIFNNPFSYIWGAPGTGKTQFVLSYAVLHYIRQGFKIAILAPTNNSIEQVLRGVIKMTDKANIDRKQIIRLGTPSRKFAEEFPEVCEEKGVQKNIKEIDKQIDILERIINYTNNLDEIKNSEIKLKLFDKIPILLKDKTEEKAKLDEIQNVLKKKEIDIKFSNDEFNKLTYQISNEIKKLNSVGNKLKKIFTSKPTTTESNIELFETKITTVKKQIEFLKYEYSEIETNKQVFNTNFINQETKIKSYIDLIKKEFSKFSKLDLNVQELNINNWETIKNNISNSIITEKEATNIDSHLISEYGLFPNSKPENDLIEYKILREKLASSSTEERLKSVNVIACTLDGYIGRFTEEKLNVEHIFLDEAGYANIIKSLTLFNNQIPITFLGDHMQLPPVCEINDSNIQNDEEFKNMFLWAQSAIHLDQLFTNEKQKCLLQYLNNTAFNPINIARTSLNSTYRFGNNLAEILGKHVYDKNFNSLNPIGETKILYINANGNDGQKSRTSMNEVNAIVALTNKLKQNNKIDFVILTPYKKQIRLLNNYLPQERNDLKILTVHGSQGREWETVILSVVDTNDKWFVDSTIAISKGLNLVNTAVSRAKRQLIIVCDKNYWANQQGQLITDLINNGTEILN